MAHLVATETTLYYAAVDGGATLAAGALPVGDLVVSWCNLLHGATENAFLAEAAGVAGDYNPLPPIGEWVEAGIYGWNGDLVFVRQSHVRQHDPDDEGVGALFGVYREGDDVWDWVAGEVVGVGAARRYDGVVYVLYRDIGANNWFPPPQVAAHWRVHLEPDGYPEWVQPTGGHDAYPVGAQVRHNEFIWVSLVDANVWEPGAPGTEALWQKVGSAPGPECPEFVQPTGAHDAYMEGDCVTFEGKQYISKIDFNIWSPIVYPAGWELVE